jgi:hypothetical protein
LKCVACVSKDGVVEKPDFLTWAASEDDNFNTLKEHLRGVGEKATKALLLHLYSEVAVSLAQSNVAVSLAQTKRPYNRITRR